MGAVADVQGAEAVCIDAVGDVLRDSPDDSIVEEVILIDIVEVLTVDDERLTLGTVQEGDGLGTGAGSVGPA